VEELFHTGERAIQAKSGEEDIANLSARMISSSVIKGAIDFIEKQPMVIVSSRSACGEVWVSVLFGQPGFARIIQPGTMVIDLEAILSTNKDVFYENILEDPELGSLFIDLSSKKRFRVNGQASQVGRSLQIDIREAYPNCPKYIQQRVITALPFANSIADIARGSTLTNVEKNWIVNADTFFVGSSSSTGRLDASHRGGNPGFIEILNDDTLKIPDYKGNSFYNTLGNIYDNPNTGLLLIDFEGGQTLQLNGEARVMFDQQKYWIFKTKQWIRTANHH